MAQRLSKLIFTSTFFIVLTLLFAAVSQASLFGNSPAKRFATVDEAFDFNAQQQGAQVELNWQVKNGYYLYRHQFSFTAENASLGDYTIPHGKAYKDEFFGDVEALTGFLTIKLPFNSINDNAVLSVTYQGCAESGFCYPPETRRITLTPAAAGSIDTIQANTVTEQATTADAELPFSPLWALLFGLGIAFTPCVLPMYPLISGIILGQKQRSSIRRVLALSFVYVQGMAITYTVLGIIVAAAGLKFQAAFQHPYLLIGLSVLFILLSLSMFGLYSLQLPAGLQTWLSGMSGKQQGGSWIGVFLMGAIAGLICSPCTTAPLSAILLYIAQSGNVVFGGGVLYLYALGMGIPLILVTVFGNRFMPQGGSWMQYVKEFFGFVILALPVFLLERVIGDVWGLRLWSALAVSFFIWAFVITLQYKSGWLRVSQIILLVLAVVSVKPLQDWVWGTSTAVENVQHTSDFKSIDSYAELQNELQSASGKVVMLDFYADWCVACKEFEKYTFSDSQVKTLLANKVLLQADVTANNAQHAELFEQLKILGLPTILFFDAEGRELTDMRVTGFMNASTFAQHLEKLPN